MHYANVSIFVISIFKNCMFERTSSWYKDAKEHNVEQTLAIAIFSEL